MKSRSRWLHVALQACLVLSLVVSALTGAFIATELRPASHVVAARQHAVVAVHHPALSSPVPRATATAVPTPAPPARAMLTAGGGRAIPYGAWIQAHRVRLRITLMPLRWATDVRAEAEVQPAGVPYTGTPNVIGPLVHMQGGVPLQSTLIVAHLSDGQRYHWRVRASEANDSVSAWSGDGLFGVSNVAPLPPQLVLTSVRLHGWSKMIPALFRWTDTGSRAPIDHFEYAVVQGSQVRATALVWQRTHGSVLALPWLSQGYWHVLVRAIDLAGNRSRVADWSFGLVTTGPPAPRIVAADPAQGSISDAATPSVRWSATPGVAPLAGFEYRLSWSNPPAAEAPWTPAAGTRLALARLADGAWYLQVRSVDVVGNHSQPFIWSFQLDRVRPSITRFVLFTTSFTPPIERMHFSFKLNKAATVTYQVVAAGSKAPLLSHPLGEQQPGTVTAAWDGYVGHKEIAAAGDYAIVVEATDRAGNHAQVTSVPVSVLDKRIFISISKEALWAYQGNKLFLYTLVTNGGSDTPTIPGIFHVEGKYLHWVMHSPFPPSSPLWYPDSPTNFALLYQEQGGYFVHDAPWRSNYGPGSNTAAGSPGGNYTGTHGCTNVPYIQMQTLYNWADVGTLIQIVK